MFNRTIPFFIVALIAQTSTVMGVAHITSEKQFDAEIAKPGLTVVDFFAEWCGPCKQVGPQFEKMAGKPEHKDINFLKVDVDKNDKIASKHNVRSMPTFKFYKNGKEVDMMVGASNFEKALTEKINKHRGNDKDNGKKAEDKKGEMKKEKKDEKKDMKPAKATTKKETPKTTTQKTKKMSHY